MSCSTAWGIFLDQGSKLCLLHWQVDSLLLSHQKKPSLLCPDRSSLVSTVPPWLTIVLVCPLKLRKVMKAYFLQIETRDTENLLYPVVPDGPVLFWSDSHKGLCHWLLNYSVPWNETDRNSAKILHDLSKQKNCRPSEYKFKLNHKNQESWLLSQFSILTPLKVEEARTPSENTSLHNQNLYF